MHPGPAPTLEPCAFPSGLQAAEGSRLPPRNQTAQVKRTIVQVEQKAAHIFIIYFPSSVCFILRNNLKRKAEGKAALH